MGLLFLLTIHRSSGTGLALGRLAPRQLGGAASGAWVWAGRVPGRGLGSGGEPRRTGTREPFLDS